MPGVIINVSIDTKEVKRALSALEARITNRAPIMHTLGVGLVGHVQRRLGSGALTSRWAPLNPAYRATKRNRNMLVESGSLRSSLASKADNNKVIVGTNRIYAAIHQLGGEIKPKTAKRLFFKLGTGFISTKSVKIPPRPFLTIEQQDEKMIAEIIFQFLQKK